MVQFTNHPARLAAAEAKEKNWTGPDCDLSHGGERWTTTGSCVECNNLRSRDYARRKAASPEVIEEREDRWNRRMAAVLSQPEAPVRVPAAKDPRRLAAEARGEDRWKASRCGSCRTTLRYVRPPYGCVECKRRVNSYALRQERLERRRMEAKPEAVVARLVASAERKRRRREKERRRRESPNYQASRAKFLESYERPPMTDEQRERKRATDKAYREANRDRYRAHAATHRQKRKAKGHPNAPDN